MLLQKQADPPVSPVSPPPPPPPLFLIQLHIKQIACFRLTDEEFVLHTEVSTVRVRKDKSIDM